MVTTASACPRAGDTLNQAWKNDKSKFGLKMLQKMGWTEGKGLGKNEDGISEHVRVAKKSNNLGLGAKHDVSGAAAWASTSVTFDSVLAALGKAYGNANARAQEEKQRSKSKKRKSKDKRHRKASKALANGSGHSTGIGSAEGSGLEHACAADDAPQAQVPVSIATQAASGCPSRARRVRSKSLKCCSPDDLRAILGDAAPAVELLPRPGVDPARASATLDVERQQVFQSQRDAEGGRIKGKTKSKKRGRDKSCGIGELAIGDGSRSRPAVDGTFQAGQADALSTTPRKKGRKKRYRGQDGPQGSREGERGLDAGMIEATSGGDEAGGTKSLNGEKRVKENRSKTRQKRSPQEGISQG